MVSPNELRRLSIKELLQYRLNVLCEFPDYLADKREQIIFIIDTIIKEKGGIKNGS